MSLENENRTKKKQTFFVSRNMLDDATTFLGSVDYSKPSEAQFDAQNASMIYQTQPLLPPSTAASSMQCTGGLFP